MRDTKDILPTDQESGVWRGRPVARRFLSPDGFTVLVGRTAADNDILTLKLAAAVDFWFHVASGSGSHVVVRNPTGLSRLPRETERFAGALAAWHSKARKGGNVAVHVTVCREVRKQRGSPPGTVTLGRHRTIHVVPKGTEESPGAGRARGGAGAHGTGTGEDGTGPRTDAG